MLAGTSPKSEVAILHSYDSRWAIDWQRHNRDYDPVAQLLSYYRRCARSRSPIDIVSPMRRSTGYKLVVAPGLNVLPDEVAEQLIEYVRAGGHLVLGPRSGMKDDDNALAAAAPARSACRLLGGRVEQ